MTQVNLKYRRPDGATTAGVLLTASDGVARISSIRRYDTTGGEMTRVAYTAPLGASVILDAGTWTFELSQVSDGRGGVLKGDDAVTRRVVPASGGPYDVDDLDEVTVTDSLVLAPEWKTYIDTKVAGVTAGSTTPAAIVGSTTIGQALIVTPSQAAARSAIGAAAISHTHPVSEISATGTASATTFLRGDGTWSGTPAAGNPNWVDINGKPSTFSPTAHTHVAVDLTDSSAIGRGLLTAATAAAARASIGAIGSGDNITLASLPAGVMVYAEGASTPRPTDRTDLTVTWIADSFPSNGIAGDIWFNGPSD